VNRHFRRRHPDRQQGYMLLVIVMMLTIALIALTAAAPDIVNQVKRQREEELIHRGKSYARAIKLFYKRFGRYPVTLNELQNTQNIHFIRKLYKDPLSSNGEWRVIHLGEAKYPPKGFGYNNIPAQSIGSPIGTPLGTGPAGTPGPGAALPGGVSNILGGAPAGSNQLGSNPKSGGLTPAESISKPIGTGPTIGAPIVGVASKNTGVGIHEVNERKNYNEWEFVYDPRYDIAAQMSIIPGGQTGFGQKSGGGQSGNKNTGGRK